MTWPIPSRQGYLLWTLKEGVGRGVTMEDRKTVGTPPGLTSWPTGFEPALHSLYTIFLYATGLVRPDHRSSWDKDPMRGSYSSTLSRTAGLGMVLLVASFVPAAAPAAGHHTLASVEAFLTVVGNSTDAGNLLFDKTEIILGPTPVFVNVTFINLDFTSDLQHNWTVTVAGVFHTTPLILPGETGWVEFWINQTGTFPYWCAVTGHRALGMEGAFVVTDTGTISVEAGPQGVALRAYWIGLIGIFAMVAVIIVSYFVIKYESRHHTDQREHRRRGLP